ncbi:MAG: hypothetical protein ACOC16_01875 [Nanoarchaeota archaeon]
MFKGVHNRKIDEKMRITLPKSDFILKGNREIYFVNQIDNIGLEFLLGSTIDYFEKKIEENCSLEDYPTVSTHIDKQNRIIIPDYFRTLVLNDMQCTLMGFGNYFRVYSHNNGKKYLKTIAKKINYIK